MSDNTNPQGLVGRGLPTPAVGDNVSGPFRVGRYGEQYGVSIFGDRLHGLSDEGTYFVATNPTPGTGIAGTAAPTTLSDTVTLLHIFNANAAATNGKQIYLDFLLLRPTAAGTNGTNFNLTGHLDAGPSRYTSGGSAITPVNANMNNTTLSNATIHVGALVTAAATASQRLVLHDQVRSVIKVIGDKYLLTFGNTTPMVAGMILEGTAQAMIPIACPAVVIGPQQNFLLHEWAASQSVAASFEFVLGYWER